MVSHFHLLHRHQRQRRHHRQLRIHSRSRAPDSDPTHISSLHDDIILLILSNLDTKSAVAFSTLSRSWINLPLTLPDIVLDDSLKRSDRSFREYSLEFGMFGLRQFFLRNPIDKFSLRCHFQFRDSGIQTMIRAAVWKQVKEIDIWLGRNASSGRLPQEVLTSTTLVVLKLRGHIVFDVPELVSLCNLKVFHSENIILPDSDSMGRFFEGCKSLEELFLCGSLGHITVFAITMQDLKKFTFASGTDDMSNTKLSIDAPKLEFFKYIGNSLEFSLSKKLKFLARAEILIIEHVEDRENVYNFINSFNGVKSLHLSHNAILAAYPIPLNFVLEHVTTLELGLLDSRIVLGILESASQLKELVVHSFAYLDPWGSIEAEDEVLIRWPEIVPSCLARHLRRIEFSIFSDESQDILLIEYLLRCGKMLETMTFSKLRSEAPNIPAFKEKVEGLTKCSECKFVYKNL